MFLNQMPDAYATTTLDSLNSTLANFGLGGDLSGSVYNQNQTYVVPDLYDNPAVYAAPINSNTVGATTNVQSTGQDTLSSWSDMGKRLFGDISTAVGSVIKQQGAVLGAQNAQNAPGSQIRINPQFIPGIPNLVLFGIAGFLAYKAVK